MLLVGVNGRVPDRDFFIIFNEVMNAIDQPFSFTEHVTNWEKRFTKKIIQPSNFLFIKSVD